MSVASVRLGALNLYRDRPGPLTGDQHADASMLAAVAGRAVIAMHAGAASGALAAELDAGTNFHLVVHQATGMVAEQLMISDRGAGQAPPYAFTQDRSITDVANDVVGQRLRFRPRPRDSPSP